MFNHRKRIYWFRAPLHLDNAIKIRDRKNVFFKCYLEARRSGDQLKAFYRRKALNYDTYNRSYSICHRV